MYAYDVVLLSTSAIGLQQKLDQLQKFYHDWCLYININKTKIIVFNKAGRLIKQSFLFEKQNIECVKSYRYLGINFTLSGSFTLAQPEFYNKALKALFALQRDFLSSHPNIKTSLHVFEHTIIPILLYGCEVWGSVNTFTARFRNSTPHWIIFIANIFAKNCTLNSANLFWGFTKNVQTLLFSLNLEDSHYVLILLNICYHTGIGLITWRPHFQFLRLHTWIQRIFMRSNSNLGMVLLTMFWTHLYYVEINYQSWNSQHLKEDVAL